MNAVIRFAYGKSELYLRFPLRIGEILAYVQNRFPNGLKVKMIIAFLMIFELPAMFLKHCSFLSVSFNRLN